MRSDLNLPANVALAWPVSLEKFNVMIPGCPPDPEEFLTIIMHHILALEPLLKL